jgi:YidC/Oxa1 family membrane protein insertase
MGNAQKEVFEIWKKHNCNPAYMMLPIAVQAPLFISFYFAISEMAKGVPSFAAGGPDWPLGPISMTDLTAADPTYIMPLLSSATFLATVELGGAGNPETAGAAQQTMMTKWGLRGLAVALVPMTAGFSKGVFVYWITTNGWSLLQTLAFKVPVIKKIVAIPEVPKEATIGAKASVVTKRQIEEKFGEAPAVHASNPKVSAHFAYLAHVFWRPVRPVSPLRRRRRDVYDEEQDSNEPFFDYI